MAGKYKKCPRCELNYILVDEELCPVCLAELKLAPSEDDLELCTLCGKNLITVDQVMCDECAKKRNLDDVVDEVSDGEEEEYEGNDTVSDWDTPASSEDSLGGLVGADDDDVEVISFSDLEEEDDDDDGYEDGDDSVDHFEDEDDFDIDDIDDIDDEDDEDDFDDDDEDDFLNVKKRK